MVGKILNRSLQLLLFDAVLTGHAFFKYNVEVIQHIVTGKENKTTYESEEVVDFYIPQTQLKKPEETILTELRHKLPEMKMLDVGVGAGRTTIHFASLAKEYVGIDYSWNMIKACLTKFHNYPKHISFVRADARDLKLFKNNYFDFVLFSFNGIDYVTHEDRLKILSEIRRVTKNGGYFCFSTHNLNSALNDCSLLLSRSPTYLVRELQRLLLMRLLNRKEWKTLRNPLRKQQYLMFTTGAHGFRLKTYFITPKEQLEQLNDVKFTNTKVYSPSNGREVSNPTESTDADLYFLSKAG